MTFLACTVATITTAITHLVISRAESPDRWLHLHYSYSYLHYTTPKTGATQFSSQDNAGTPHWRDYCRLIKRRPTTLTDPLFAYRCLGTQLDKTIQDCGLLAKVRLLYYYYYQKITAEVTIAFCFFSCSKLLLIIIVYINIGISSRRIITIKKIIITILTNGSVHCCRYHRVFSRLSTPYICVLRSLTIKMSWGHPASHSVSIYIANKVSSRLGYIRHTIPSSLHHLRKEPTPH